MKFLSIQIGLAILVTLFQLNAAILTNPNEKSTVQEFSKKTKRGILGFGAHGHHHGHHQHHPEHFEDWQAQHNHPPPPQPPLQPALGSHFHTTITKKVGIPVPYPVPVKVSHFLTY